MGDQEGTADGDAQDGIDYLLSGAEAGWPGLRPGHDMIWL